VPDQPTDHQPTDRPGARAGETAAAAPPPLRASDADRHAVVARLQDAVARGLLTPEEGSERMAAAYAARHVHDLPPLTTDLPPAPTAPRAAAGGGWRELGTLAALQARSTVSGIAAGGLRSPRTVALLTALVVAVLLVLALGAAGLHELLDGGPHGALRPH
jgi:hypothetical protein